MNITEFFEADGEVFREVPNTNLEISNFCRLRNVVTKEWFGRLLFAADLKGVAEGITPVDLKTVVMRTERPGIFFADRHRAEAA